MKHRRVLYTLVIAVAVIWGIIVYEFRLAMEESDRGLVTTAQRSKRIQASSDGSSSPFIYSKDVRDPFRYQPQVARMTPSAVRTEPPWKAPALTLTGIVGVPGKRTAVLEDSAGVTYVLQPGDTLAGVKIVSIKDHQVQYRFRQKQAAWILQPEGH